MSWLRAVSQEKPHFMFVLFWMSNSAADKGLELVE